MYLQCNTNINLKMPWQIYISWKLALKVLLLSMWAAKLFKKKRGMIICYMFIIFLLTYMFYCAYCLSIVIPMLDIHGTVCYNVAARELISSKDNYWSHCHCVGHLNLLSPSILNDVSTGINQRTTT